MNTNNELYIDDGIDMFDGYISEPIWTLPGNYSTYCSEKIDSQCTIPGLDLEEIFKELGKI